MLVSAPHWEILTLADSSNSNAACVDKKTKQNKKGKDVRRMCTGCKVHMCTVSPKPLYSEMHRKKHTHTKL